MANRPCGCDLSKPISIEEWIGWAGEGCGVPGCGCGGPMYINPRCHPRRGVEVVVDAAAGLFHVHCLVCRKLVVAVATGVGQDQPSIPRVLRAH